MLTGVCGAAPQRLKLPWCVEGEPLGVEFFIDFVPAPPSAPAAWGVVVGSDRSTVPPLDGKASPQLATMPLMAAPHDTELSILVMVDHTVCEAFFNGGRIAMVTPVPTGALFSGVPTANNTRQGVEVFAQSHVPVTVLEASVYGVRQIFTDMRTHDRE